VDLISEPGDSSGDATEAPEALRSQLRIEGHQFVRVFWISIGQPRIHGWS